MNARTCRGDSADGCRLVDRFGRQITYLRLSITDRCNLRCRYCMPEEGVDALDHTSVLSYEELERLAAIFVGLGVSKIRITGGEPFVRKGCLEFLQRLKQRHPDLALHLTTNGVAVLPYLGALKQLDIGGINLSLDTLSAERFREITRRDRLETVLEVFQEIQRLAIPLKVNAVVQQDTTDDELRQLADLIREHQIALRFIELMPFSGKGTSGRARTEPLLARLTRIFPAMREQQADRVETARRFSLPGHLGTLGIIEGESRKFCATCNKLRVTASGLMKNCLYDNGVLDLRTLLREEPDDAAITREIRAAVAAKQKSGYEAERDCARQNQESMASIGG